MTTEVLEHWSTVKSAYRVTLADGTELVASGDHRFLTGRGWKHVTGAMGGPDQRPYLTTNDTLLGFGRSVDHRGSARVPARIPDRLMRGDANLKATVTARGRAQLTSTGSVWRWPTSRVCIERSVFLAMRRAHDWFDFTPATGRRA